MIAHKLFFCIKNYCSLEGEVILWYYENEIIEGRNLTMENKNKIITLAAIAALIIVALGTTYAYFTAQITGGESASTIIVTGGKMEIIYDNLSDEITAANIYPKEEASSFTMRLGTKG